MEVECAWDDQRIGRCMDGDRPQLKFFVQICVEAMEEGEQMPD
jgi:hypothetical protein